MLTKTAVDTEKKARVDAKIAEAQQQLIMLSEAEAEYAEQLKAIEDEDAGFKKRSVSTEIFIGYGIPRTFGRTRYNVEGRP